MTKRATDKVGVDINVYSMDAQFKLGEAVALTSNHTGYYCQNIRGATLSAGASTSINSTFQCSAQGKTAAVPDNADHVPDQAFFWAITENSKKNPGSNRYNQFHQAAVYSLTATTWAGSSTVASVATHLQELKNVVGALATDIAMGSAT